MQTLLSKLALFKWARRGLVVGLVGLGAVVGLAAWVRFRYEPYIFAPESAPARRVAILDGTRTTRVGYGFSGGQGDPTDAGVGATATD